MFDRSGTASVVGGGGGSGGRRYFESIFESTPAEIRRLPLMASEPRERPLQSSHRGGGEMMREKLSQRKRGRGYSIPALSHQRATFGTLQPGSS